MKHTKLVSNKPMVAQVNENFQAKLDFKVDLTDQIIDFSLSLGSTLK